MNQDKELNKRDILIIILLIFSIGAYSGAYYADNNWKHDLEQFAEHNDKFRFNPDDTQTYYLIQKKYLYSVNETTGRKQHIVYNMSNITIYNDTINDNYIMK